MDDSSHPRYLFTPLGKSIRRYMDANNMFWLYRKIGDLQEDLIEKMEKVERDIIIAYEKIDPPEGAPEFKDDEPPRF